MNKIKAAGLHFTLSLLVIGGFIVFLNYFWYQNLVRVTGVVEPLKLLVLIDVVLGPLLTFIVYKKGKRTLKFDLAVIVLMQLSAFVYGAYTIYQGKPSWLVFNANAFEVVYAKEIKSAPTGLENNSIFSRPKLAYIPYHNQTMGLAAHHNFKSALPLGLNDWDNIKYQSIGSKEAAVLAGMAEDEIKTKVQSKEMYRISNDGLFSVMVVVDKSRNKFSSFTQFH